jgi:hypothetical protein
MANPKYIVFDVEGFAKWLDSETVLRAISLIQNHHTWNPSYIDFKGNNHIQLLMSMEKAHIERGFFEIAQHITTFPDGAVAVCRAFDKIPTGIKGANICAVCIENLGCFDLEHDNMTESQRKSIIRINALLCSKFFIYPSAQWIVYHHWYDVTTGERKDGMGDTKTCPGSAFFGGNRVEDAVLNLFPQITQSIEKEHSGAPQIKPSELYQAQVAVDCLNVRAEPRSSGKLLRQLRKGAIVRVFELQGAWSNISSTGTFWANRDCMIEV